MYTFKQQAKSNAKRFLVQTAKVANFEEYLTQDADGNWGCYLDEAGKPVPFAKLPSTTANANASEQTQHNEPEPGTPEGDAAEAAVGNSAFGAFAMGQLTAPSNNSAQAAAPATAAPATGGLKIQKERETRNGFTRFSPGSVGDKLFCLYDAARANGEELTLQRAKELAAAEGLNTTSAGLALYSWRKFNGIGKPTKA